jgi:hypothetical protein
MPTKLEQVAPCSNKVHCKLKAFEVWDKICGGKIDDTTTAPAPPAGDANLGMLNSRQDQQMFGNEPILNNSSFVVDILSVSSVTQEDLLRAQQDTFASHVSVRTFFNVTEFDDADPDCYKHLTLDDVRAVSNFCRSRPRGLSHVMHSMRGQYGRMQWLEKKANPAGWVCAQVRPYSGLLKVYKHYEESKHALPDYLIMMDDDTYYNMEQFQRNFAKMNSSQDLFYAGCLVRWPIHQINITFPFGGFGSILSQGSLRNLFEPIYCPPHWSENNSTLIRRQSLCNRIAESNIGENRYFKSGMNLVELMYHYVSTEKYRDVKEWSRDGGGYCMHSDWVIGYFANYYNVSNHVENPFYARVPHARIEAYQGSEIYKGGTGFCINEGDCKAASEICHYATPRWMKDETDRLRLKVPDKFRSA